MTISFEIDGKLETPGETEPSPEIGSTLPAYQLGGLRMEKLRIEMENCYGISRLSYEFDFEAGHACAIYAPNGSMKSSFAETLRQIAEGNQPCDRFFPDRKSQASVTDETGKSLLPENIIVIRPFVPEAPMPEDTCNLLINPNLKREYLQLKADIEKPRSALVAALSKQSGLKKGDIETEFSMAITGAPDRFYQSLLQLRELVSKQKDAPFANVPYEVVFNENVLKFLEQPDVRANLEEYVLRYDTLIAKSTYFKKGIFEYHNASTISKQLDDQGFFDAKHTVHLNADKSIEEITSRAQLDKLIKDEHDTITNDPKLRAQFEKLAQSSYKNQSLRDFREYVMKDNFGVLRQLLNPVTFKQDVWRSYLKQHSGIYEEFMNKYNAIDKRKEEIEKEAAQERTKWDDVISEFNDRFIVPFKLIVENKVAVILTEDPVLRLGYVFKDGGGERPVDRKALTEGLSQGESKALCSAPR